MLKRICKLWLMIFILNISTISYSEIKEIITIEEYSKQFLDENFILEDMKPENTEKINIETDKIDVKEINIKEEKDAEEDISEEKYKEEMKKIEVQKKIEEAKKVEAEVEKEKKIEKIEKIATKEKIVELKENQVIENKEKKETKEKNIEQSTTKVVKIDENINWDLPNNFRSVLIGDLNGNVFYSKNADNIYPLASVTKMMTLMVTFDEIKAGRVSLKDKVKITKDVAYHGGSGIPLKVGQIYVLEDLIKASAIYSANNATYAIARHVGKGSIDNFITKMNKKAENLGISKDIKYYTPAGLPTRMTKKPMDSGTARAIYKLSIEALKYKKYIQIAGIKETTIYGGKVKIKNRNHLIGEEGVYGIKTGYHKEAKYNISVASKIDDIDVIVVVMGGETYTSRDRVVLDVLKTFKENYYGASILDKTVILDRIKVEGLNVPVVPDRNYKIALKKSQKYRVEVLPRENIKLNIQKGEKMGIYKVYVDNKVVLTGNVLAQKAVKK